MRCFPIVAATALFVALSEPCYATQSFILETASYPITGVLSGQGGVGFSIGGFQYLAARFTLTQTTNITQVGGLIHRLDFTGNSLLFAALAAIDAPNGYPADTPYTFQPIAQ